MNEQGSIARHFSKGSEVYEQEASLQREIAQELMKHIGTEYLPTRILDVGCGTGFLTGLIADAYPEAELDAIDVSAKMIEKARELVPDRRINWISKDARRFSFPTSYDLIASSSAIQWMYPHKTLFETFARILRPGGRVHFALMLRGTLKELHSLRREIAPQKQLRAELASADEVVSSLKGSGLDACRLDVQVYRRSYTTAADFLWRIKEQGFTGGEISTADRPLTRGELRLLMERYSKAFDNKHGGVYATFCVGYFEARLSPV